jgi:hypothetical protein
MCRWIVSVAFLGLMLAGDASAQARGFNGGGFGGLRSAIGRGFGGHTFGRGGFIPGHRGFFGAFDLGGRTGFRIGNFRAAFGGWYGRTPWSAGVWWPVLYPSPGLDGHALPYPHWAGVGAATNPVVVTPPPPRSASPIWLVAEKDGTMWAARSYWIEDGSLHFVTMRDERKSIPTDQLDHELSEQLNRERGLDFRVR